MQFVRLQTDRGAVWVNPAQVRLVRAHHRGAQVVFDNRVAAYRVDDDAVVCWESPAEVLEAFAQAEKGCYQCNTSPQAS